MFTFTNPITAGTKHPSATLNLDLSVLSTIDDQYAIDEDDNGQHILLGKGRFSVVYLGHKSNVKHLHKVAIKVLVPFKKGDKNGENVARREQIPEHLNQQNIIRILHKKCNTALKEEEEYMVWMIVMECCQSTLATFIHSKTPAFETRLNLLVQLSKGILYLHQSLIIHRDIKPENILIQEKSNQPVLILGDFGLAEKLQDHTTRLTQRVGTKPWMPPEVLKGERYGLEADIFPAAHVFLAVMVCSVRGNKCNSTYCAACRTLCLFNGKCKIQMFFF